MCRGIVGRGGTGAHRLDGDLPDADRPITFGHEGVGVIEALGAGATPPMRRPLPAVVQGCGPFGLASTIPLDTTIE